MYWIPLKPYLLIKFKVSGHSMMPIFNEGQEILVSSVPYFFSQPKIGDVIAFKDQEKFVVKRIKKFISGRLQVTGDNKNDSKDYGWIERKDIIGKVIHKLN